MDQLELHADIREITGKEVKSLRRQGIVPVNVFGRGIESSTLQCDALKLQQILNKAGRTRLVNLKVGKARKVKKVIVREVQRDPVKAGILHVDFYEVGMTDKLKVEIPILFSGDSPALKIKGTMLMREMSSIIVECLPDDIPENIHVDLSVLTEIGKVITVKDIVPGKGITIVTESNHEVARVSYIRETVEEVVAEIPTAEAPAATAEVPAAEGKAEAEGQK
ncbi:MAG: 50S ribosomal protein L25 [Chloroflexi bacterium]|nr:50S ribosomal protein L25 [Chloroflexota bacterium]